MEPNNKVIDSNIKWIHETQNADAGNISTDGDIKWSEPVNGKVQGIQKVLVHVEGSDKPIEYEIVVNNISAEKDKKEAAIVKMNAQMKKLVVLALVHGVCSKKKITYGQGGYKRVLQDGQQKIKPLDIKTDANAQEVDQNYLNIDPNKHLSDKKTKQLKMAQKVNAYILPQIQDMSISQPSESETNSERSEETHSPKEKKIANTIAAVTTAAVGAGAALSAAYQNSISTTAPLSLPTDNLADLLPTDMPTLLPSVLPDPLSSTALPSIVPSIVEEGVCSALDDGVCEAFGTCPAPSPLSWLTNAFYPANQVVSNAVADSVVEEGVCSILDDGVCEAFGTCPAPSPLSWLTNPFFSPANQVVSNAVADSVVEEGVCSILDDGVCEAFGTCPAPSPLSWLTNPFYPANQVVSNVVADSVVADSVVEEGVCSILDDSVCAIGEEGASTVLESISTGMQDIGTAIYNNSWWIAGAVGLAAAGYVAYRNRETIKNVGKDIGTAITQTATKVTEGARGAIDKLTDGVALLPSLEINFDESEKRNQPQSERLMSDHEKSGRAVGEALNYGGSLIKNGTTATFEAAKAVTTGIANRAGRGLKNAGKNIGTAITQTAIKVTEGARDAIDKLAGVAPESERLMSDHEKSGRNVGKVLKSTSEVIINTLQTTVSVARSTGDAAVEAAKIAKKAVNMFNSSGVTGKKVISDHEESGRNVGEAVRNAVNSLTDRVSFLPSLKINFGDSEEENDNGSVSDVNFSQSQNNKLISDHEESGRNVGKVLNHGGTIIKGATTATFGAAKAVATGIANKTGQAVNVVKDGMNALYNGAINNDKAMSESTDNALKAVAGSASKRILGITPLSDVEKAVIGIGVIGATTHLLHNIASYVPMPNLSSVTDVIVDQGGTLIATAGEQVLDQATGTQVIGAGAAFGIALIGIGAHNLKDRLSAMPFIGNAKNKVGSVAKKGFTGLKGFSNSMFGKVASGLSGLKNQVTLPSMKAIKFQEEDINIIADSDDRFGIAVDEVQNVEGSEDKISFEIRSPVSENKQELAERIFIEVFSKYSNGMVISEEEIRTARNYLMFLKNELDEGSEECAEIQENLDTLAIIEDNLPLLKEFNEIAEEVKKEYFTLYSKFQNDEKISDELLDEFKLSLEVLENEFMKLNEEGVHNLILANDLEEMRADYAKMVQKNEELRLDSIKDQLKELFEQLDNYEMDQVHYRGDEAKLKELRSNYMETFQSVMNMHTELLRLPELDYERLYPDFEKAFDFCKKEVKKHLSILNAEKELIDDAKILKENFLKIWKRHSAKKIISNEKLELFLSDIKILTEKRNTLIYKGVFHDSLNKDINLMNSSINEIINAKFTNLLEQLEQYKLIKAELKKASEIFNLQKEYSETFKEIVNLFKLKVALPEIFIEAYFFSLAEIANSNPEAFCKETTEAFISLKTRYLKKDKIEEWEIDHVINMLRIANPQDKSEFESMIKYMEGIKASLRMPPMNPKLVQTDSDSDMEANSSEQIYSGSDSEDFLLKDEGIDNDDDNLEGPLAERINPGLPIEVKAGVKNTRNKVRKQAKGAEAAIEYAENLRKAANRNGSKKETKLEEGIGNISNKEPNGDLLEHLNEGDLNVVFRRPAPVRQRGPQVVEVEPRLEAKVDEIEVAAKAKVDVINKFLGHLNEAGVFRKKYDEYQRRIQILKGNDLAAAKRVKNAYYNREIQKLNKKIQVLKPQAYGRNEIQIKINGYEADIENFKQRIEEETTIDTVIGIYNIESVSLLKKMFDFSVESYHKVEEKENKQKIGTSARFALDELKRYANVPNLKNFVLDEWNPDLSQAHEAEKAANHALRRICLLGRVTSSKLKSEEEPRLLKVNKNGSYKLNLENPLKKRIFEFDKFSFDKLYDAELEKLRK